MITGEKIKYFRNMRGISQETLGQLSGINSATIKKYEYGIRNPKPDQLLKIANENNVNFLFEASVGGGIPVLRPIAQCLAANEVSEVAGILNGTTNYMLTRMVEDGISFETALAEAQ